MKVLIVRLTSLGDVLFAMSIIGDLQRHRPDISLDWVVDTRFAELVTASSAVRKIWALPLRDLRSRFQWAHICTAFTTLAALRRERYDLIVDLQGMLKSGLTALIARGGKRWTYKKNLMAEPALWRFFDHFFSASKAVHALENYRKIGGLIFDYETTGKPNFHFKTAQEQSTPELRQILDRPFIICFPFASKVEKVIPQDEWFVFARELEKSGLAVRYVLLAGSESERKQADFHASVSTHFTVAPRLEIGGVIELIKRARGFVGADSGLTYLAAACGIPTIAVFVGTDPAVLDPGSWAEKASFVHISQGDWSGVCIDTLRKLARTYD